MFGSSMVGIEKLSAFDAMGGNFHDGMFVAGENTSTIPLLSPFSTPTVTVTATTPDTAEGSGFSLSYFTLSDTTGGDLTVYFSLGGIAVRRRRLRRCVW